MSVIDCLLSLVPRGGLVFGAFITLHGSRRLLATFSRLCRQHSADPTVVAPDAFMTEAMKKLGARFHAFMNTAPKSQGLRTQRFFATFMARYHGLSILGCDLLSPMGTMMPSTTYDRMLVEIVRTARQQGRYIDE